jgi:steroid 5-alpha reductase family enzyme
MLSQKYSIRIDKAWRMYTVLNIPEELVGEAFSLKKSDIDRISDNYIRQFYTELGQELNKNGLTELFNIYDIQKVDKYSYLVVIGFSLFKSQKYFNLLYYIGIPVSIILLILLSILVF